MNYGEMLRIDVLSGEFLPEWLREYRLLSTSVSRNHLERIRPFKVV